MLVCGRAKFCPEKLTCETEKTSKPKDSSKFHQANLWWLKDYNDYDVRAFPSCSSCGVFWSAVNSNKGQWWTNLWRPRLTTYRNRIYWCQISQNNLRAFVEGIIQWIRAVLTPKQTWCIDPLSLTLYKLSSPSEWITLTSPSCTFHPLKVLVYGRSYNFDQKHISTL